MCDKEKFDDDSKGKAVDFAIAFLKGKKLEGLSIFGYCLTKAFAKSPPSRTELLIMLIYIVTIGLLKYVARTRLGKAFIDSIVDFFDTIPENFLYKDMRPHQLIQWLTKGRFDTNISCREKVTFEGKECMRRGCRFDCEKRDDTPETIWKRMPNRTKLVRRVRLGPHQAVLDEGVLGPPGDLIGWNSLGITFRVNSQYWTKIQKVYGESAPIRLTAHVRLWFRLARLRIEPRRSRLDGNDEVICGNFIAGYQFNPKKIRKSLNSTHKWISMPICDLLHQERNPTKRRIYTPVPIIE
jgi:hypothetical protein